MTYEQAMKELQEIVHGLENEAIGVDDLSNKMKRATELLEYCKNKLHTTKEELKKLSNDEAMDEL